MEKEKAFESKEEVKEVKISKKEVSVQKGTSYKIIGIRENLILAIDKEGNGIHFTEKGHEYKIGQSITR